MKWTADCFSFCIANVLIVRHERSNSFDSKRKCVMPKQKRKDVPSIFANYKKEGFLTSNWKTMGDITHLGRTVSMPRYGGLFPLWLYLGGSLNSNTIFNPCFCQTYPTSQMSFGRTNRIAHAQLVRAMRQCDSKCDKCLTFVIRRSALLFQMVVHQQNLGSSLRCLPRTSAAESLVCIT